MSEKNSQSIQSDRISESTIARMAGNIFAGVAAGAYEEANSYSDDLRISWAVGVARKIAKEVRQTTQTKGR